MVTRHELKYLRNLCIIVHFPKSRPFEHSGVQMHTRSVRAGHVQLMHVCRKMCCSMCLQVHTMKRHWFLLDRESGTGWKTIACIYYEHILFPIVNENAFAQVRAFFVVFTMQSEMKRKSRFCENVFSSSVCGFCFCYKTMTFVKPTVCWSSWFNREQTYKNTHTHKHASCVICKVFKLKTWKNMGNWRVSRRDNNVQNMLTFLPRFWSLMQVARTNMSVGTAETFFKMKQVKQERNS